MERQRSVGLGFLSPRDGAAAVGARLLSGVTAGVSGMSVQTGKTLKRFYRGFSNAFKVRAVLWPGKSFGRRLSTFGITDRSLAATSLRVQREKGSGAKGWYNPERQAAQKVRRLNTAKRRGVR